MGDLFEPSGALGADEHGFGPEFESPVYRWVSELVSERVGE